MTTYDLTQRELLTNARQFIAGGWTQGANARDAAGFYTDACGVYAACFCLSGAIQRAAYAGWDEGDNDDQETRSQAYRAGTRALAAVLPLITPGDDGQGLPGVRVVHFNDAPGRTVDEVLAVLDTAIALSGLG